MKRNVLEALVAVGVLVSLLVGGLNYFAKAKDPELVELRLDQKILSDQIMQTQQRVWQLEDRHGGQDCTRWNDQKDREEYRRLKEIIEQLKRRRDQLIRRGNWPLRPRDRAGLNFGLEKG